MSQASDHQGHSPPPADKEPKKLVERFRAAIRERHYSRRTEKTYWYWIRYYIFFHRKRHPAEMGAAQVSAFLSWLATDREVAAATQNQALSALLFLYKHVLGQDLPWLGDLGRVRALHRRDLAEGFGAVWLPHALARKYPRAAREWGWQLVFSSGNRSADPESGVIRRHHVHPDTLSRIVKRAAQRANLVKPV